MLILDKPRRFDGRRILIPLYHRGHLSLFPGAKIWMCLLPGASDDSAFPELVVSPIRFDSWSDLWRIEIALHERPGLVNQVFTLLKEQGLNILASESSSMERQSLHVAEVIVDGVQYTDYDDGTHEDRSTGRINELSGLRKTILAHVIDDVSFDSDEQPRLAIRRVGNLFEARQAFMNAKERSQGRGGPRPIVQDARLVVEDGRYVKRLTWIELPADIRRTLREVLGSTEGTPRPAGVYLNASETTDRFLRTFFFRAGYPILAPTLVHKEAVGALAAITEGIARAGFNIVTSISRLYQYGAEARTEFVLQPIARGEEGEANLQHRLEAALSSRELVEDYGVRISYERSYGAPFEPRRLEVRESILTRSTFRLPETREGNTTEVLLKKHRYFGRLSRKATGDGRDRYRKIFNLLSALLSEQDVAAGKARFPLFISYAFLDEDRFQRISRSAARRSFDVVTGKDLGGEVTTRDGVKRLMESCECFLGVWTEAGGVQVGNGRWWPSPWLLWELGVAESRNLPFKLLISDQVDPAVWQKLVPSHPHIIFSAANFDKKLKEALKALRALLMRKKEVDSHRAAKWAQ